MVITSLDNKEMKQIAKLNQRKYRELEQRFIVEGYHLVEEAQKQELLEKIIILEGVSYSTNVPHVMVSREVMKKISMMESIPEVLGICQMKKEMPIGNKVLVLDTIQDPGNLGTIIRSSVAFGVDTIILSENTVDLYNSKVIRSTQGMLFHINIVRKNLLETIGSFKNKGYVIYTTDVVDGVCVKDIIVPEKYMIIVGNEGNGVSEEVSSMADQKLYIPMKKEVESLNVGVAASILLYEMGNLNE